MTGLIRNLVLSQKQAEKHFCERKILGKELHTMFRPLLNCFQKLEGVPPNERLEKLLRDVGCEFYGDGLIKKPVVAIVGVGGILVNGVNPLRIGGVECDMHWIRERFDEARALGGYMSYLNPGDKDIDEMVHIQSRYGHFSSAHLCPLVVGLFGISIGVEHEFDCQRDLVYLARLTVSRTSAQNIPPFVVGDITQLDSYRVLRDHVAKIRSSFSIPDRNALEVANGIWPKCSATVVLLSGSLRNFQKLISQKSDLGKELEYRMLLGKLEEVLYPLAPDMFNPSVSGACVVLERRHDGMILMIDRRDGTGFGLPGGKVEVGEEPIDAAMRELQEETGVLVKKDCMRLIYDGVTDNGKRAQTFHVWCDDVGIVSSLEGEIRWGSKGLLLGERGAYPRYNKEVIDRCPTL